MHNSLLCNKLGALWAVVDSSLHDALGPVSRSRAAALLTLHHFGRMTTTELSRIIGLSQPATTRLVDKIAGDGLLARRSRTSGKEVDLRLTRKGEQAAQVLQRRRLESMSMLVAPLTETRRRQLEALLDEMLGTPVTSRAYARFVCRFCDHEICDGSRCPIGCAATAIERHQGGRGDSGA